MRTGRVAFAVLASVLMTAPAVAQAPTYTAAQLSALPQAPHPVIVDDYRNPKHPGYGSVSFGPALRHPFVSLTTTLTVPPKPAASGNLFLWPGLGSGPKAPHFRPLGNGVLQPVLKWGHGCVAAEHRDRYTSWWITGAYINTGGDPNNIAGCHGGEAMDVRVGDELDLEIKLAGTVWKQTVTDRQTGKSVTFDYDLGGQEQIWAYFTIETKDREPTVPIVFRNTTLRWSGPSREMCFPYRMGKTDSLSAPVASADQTSCTIDTIVLKAVGIP
jgi:hypothetical protein